MNVGEDVVHGRQSGRPQVAQVGHLNGRRLAGERPQPVPARMTGKVHQDIDVVLADPSGGLCVREPDQRKPMVGMTLEASRGCIGSRDVGVAEDLEAMMVMGGEDRLQEGDDGMLTEVG